MNATHETKGRNWAAGIESECGVYWVRFAVRNRPDLSYWDDLDEVRVGSRDEARRLALTAIVCGARRAYYGYFYRDGSPNLPWTASGEYVLRYETFRGATRDRVYLYGSDGSAEGNPVCVSEVLGEAYAAWDVVTIFARNAAEVERLVGLAEARIAEASALLVGARLAARSVRTNSGSATWTVDWRPSNASEATARAAIAKVREAASILEAVRRR